MARTTVLMLAVLVLLGTVNCVSKSRHIELQQSMAVEQERSIETQKALEDRIDMLTRDMLRMQEENENLERRHENVLEINNQLHAEVLRIGIPAEEK